MTRRARTVLFVVAACGLAAVLAWGIAGLPAFGAHTDAYGAVLNQVAVPQRHAANVVNAVTYDYRALDTLGEEFILLAATLGVLVLLRELRSEHEEAPSDEAVGRRPPAASDAVRVLGLGMIGPMVVLGVYIVAHGHISPGGGFQGGVILAAGLLLAYLAGEYVLARRLEPPALVEAAEAVGAGAFALLGFAGLLAGGVFLVNFLPLGTPGELLSAGMIPVISSFVGLEVAAAFVLLFFEFLFQLELVRQDRAR